MKSIRDGEFQVKSAVIILPLFVSAALKSTDEYLALIRNNTVLNLQAVMVLLREKMIPSKSNLQNVVMTQDYLGQKYKKNV